MSNRKQEIFDAVVARLLELGYAPVDLDRSAKLVADDWHWFSTNPAVDHETYRRWLDPVLRRLFDEYLRIAVHEQHERVKA